MPDAPAGFGRVTIEQLKGLNERNKDANLDLGYFDVLKGFVPTSENTLTKINGTKTFHFRPGEKILGFCQTNDSRQNIIVQTNLAEYTVNEDEFFQRVAYVPNVAPQVLIEEEDMAIALLTHSTASATNGGTYTTANVWQQAPLTEIVYQVNPDGSAAAFCTLLANQFTLAAGVYRISGWRGVWNSNTITEMYARLWNVTAAAPAFNALGIEKTMYRLNGAGEANQYLHLGEGILNLGGSTVFEVQVRMNNAQANTGFGLQAPLTGSRNLYSQIKILKTA